MSSRHSLREGVATPLILGAVGFWLYQLYFYLRWGHWLDGSLVSSIEYAGWFFNDLSLQLWARNPQSWLGLHNVLTWIPTALVSFLLGLLVLAT